MALNEYKAPVKRKKEQPQRKILYVEDDDLNWVLAERRLREKYIIHRAKDSREAFERLRSATYTAILMDIELQGSDLNGVEITQILRGKRKNAVPEYARDFDFPKQIPIIFVTAYSARYTEAVLMSCGGDRLIPKPVDFIKLALTIADFTLNNSQSKWSKVSGSNEPG